MHLSGLKTTRVMRAVKRRQGIKIEPGSRRRGGIAHAGSITWLQAGARTLPPLYARLAASGQGGRPWFSFGLVRVSPCWGDFLGPYREALERVRTKGRSDRDVGRIATAGEQHPADARNVVARIKGIPLAAEIGFEPGCEIHRRVHGRHADIAQITGAISRRNVHAATEGDGQVSIIPANAGTIAEGFPSRPAGARVLVAEGDVLMNVVADGLDAAPAERRIPEERPGDLGKPVGLAVTAAQQEHQGLVGQILDSMLP